MKSLVDELDKVVGLIRQGFSQEALRIVSNLRDTVFSHGLDIDFSFGGVEEPIAGDLEIETVEVKEDLPEFRLVYDGDKIVAVEIFENGVWVIPPDVHEKVRNKLVSVVSTPGSVFVKEMLVKKTITELLREMKRRKQLWRRGDGAG